jgi:hypothetical protein
VRIHEISRETKAEAVVALVNQQQEQMIGMFVTLLPDEARMRHLPT